MKKMMKKIKEDKFLKKYSKMIINNHNILQKNFE